MTDGIDRRRFLKVLGVTGGGAAALSACGIGPEPTRKLIPYLVAPEDQIPGTATVYASTCRECAAGCGIHVRVREGHAVKLEGNPDSPVNAGRLCARGQAALQGLYHPDRLRGPKARDAEGRLVDVTWDEALQRLRDQVGAARGQGIVFVTGQEPGALGDLVDEWVRQQGGRHITYEPFAFEALREGNRLAFGAPDLPRYDFAAAAYVLSFGADFLDTWLSPVAFQQAFARARGFEAGRRTDPARLVYVGPRLSVTGMNADEWLAPSPGSEGRLALAMAHVIVRDGLAPPRGDLGRVTALLDRHAPAEVAGSVGLPPETIERVARDFARSGAPLAVAGGMAAHYPNGAAIVAAVNVLNAVAGAIGRTMYFGPDSALAAPGRYADMVVLQAEMAQGQVALLLVHGANPSHSMPAGFAQAMERVGFVVSFATVLDETAAAADLVLPDLHPLEQWNESRPQAGVIALQQPVMQPVFPDCRAAGDVLLASLDRPGGFRAYLEGRWRELHRRAGGRVPFDQFWSEALQRGGLYMAAGTRDARLAVDADALGDALAPAAPASDRPVCVVFPHPALYDGRGANKPWLQELPDPVSKITWHAWVEVHPETAGDWGVVSGDVVLLTSPAGAVRAPVWVTPSVRPGAVAVPTGQGHAAYGRYATDRSFNAFTLLPETPTGYGGRTFVVPVGVAYTGEHRRLATVEGSPREQGRGTVEVLPLAAAASLAAGDHPFHHEETPEYARDAVEGWAEAQHRKAELGNYAGDQPRWGLAVDLTRCTGCSACVTACYAENNIATVGEELVGRGREMAWLRIERYWLTDGEGSPQGAVAAPIMCQHCGNAPCEPVCPVFAAYHTPDGLNGQVYNRCVGTRYCANNCPYKVRYFNWFNYAESGGRWEAWPEPLQLLLNPDVTVREKGVMEKCTFCVQRIRGAQNQARLEDRAVRDGEIVPACAQTCPAEAIVFGDLADATSRVSALARDPRGYHVLAGLNTQPAVTYLARVRHVAAATPAHAEH